MTSLPILAKVVAALEYLEVPCMLAGSFASSHHGAPRTTHDIDIVVNPSLSQLDGLLVRIEGPDTYADRDVARQELGSRGQFNVIDIASGWKIDRCARQGRLVMGSRCAMACHDVSTLESRTGK